ncbi:MAG: alpha/beta hydrolase [Eubacteriales bacterium]|nr:alpha/beta hydrolase [Eubacteriales bacterium]
MSIVLEEKTYAQKMAEEVEPYLELHGESRETERENGKRIFYVKYLADQPKGVVLISHGFTESTEKYKENIYYFLKAGYDVYMHDHCGHGRSYRLVEDMSLVYVDRFERYVEDLLHMTKLIEKEHPGLPLYLYGHSMGGGVAAAAAARRPKVYAKLILSSPMIRPITGGLPWGVTKLIDGAACLMGKEKDYVPGAHPYGGMEKFEDSASVNKERFLYYEKKRATQSIYQTCAPSFGWLREAIRLNHDLQSQAWKRISVPVLLFQSGKDTFVVGEQQELFVKKINEHGKTRAKLVRFPEAKHEIFNSDSDTVERYWNMIFKFMQE